MAFTAIPLTDLRTVDETARLLAPHLGAGDTLALQGSLGAGKTTFARSLLRTLGIKGEVPSPTFTLVQMYETPQYPIYHFDLYRLESETEMMELGWDEALASGLVIVEWPERAPHSLPLNRLTLQFSMNENGDRHLSFEPAGTWKVRVKDIV